MGRVLLLVMGLGLMALNGWGQAPGSNANQVILTAPPPPVVSSVNANVIGTAGVRTFYYWVVAKYPAGNAVPQGPVGVFNAPNAMSVSNYVRVAWTGIPGASSYDVLRTTTPNLPNGAASILVGNTSSLFITNTSDSLTSYTISNVPGATWSVQLDNRNYPYAVATFASDPITPSYIVTGTPTIPCVQGQHAFQSDASTPGDNVWWCVGDPGVWYQPSGGGGGGAPTNATYITQTPNASLSAEQALNSLATGLMQVTTATGVVSSVTTSAGVAALISDETGTGAMVFASSPTLVTPNIGAATATSINGLTLTASTGTVTITNAKTLAVQNSVTFSGTDGSTVQFGAGGLVTYRTAGATTTGNCPTWTAGGELSPTGVACSTGTGDVVGPASAVDGQPAVYDGTTGKIIKTLAVTSGGVLYGSAANVVASSGALTANLPVIGGGAGVAPSSGSRSGNTTSFATTTGTVTGGTTCAQWDTNGNLTATASSCGAGSATVLAGTATIDFASVVDGACSATSNITVTGALTTDTPAYVQAPISTSGVWFDARITGADTVAVKVCNLSGSAVDLASGTYRAAVVRP